MTASNDYVRDVLARMDDFAGPAVQWQRTLWGVSLPFALRELQEVSDGVRSGALSVKILKRFAQEVATIASRDPAAGEENPRKRLKTLLTQNLSAGGAGYHELRTWRHDVEAHWLARWRAAVSSPDKPSREQLARSLTNELLRHGFSTERIRTWIRELHSIADPVDDGRLLSEVEALVHTPPRTFSAMLIFLRPPKMHLLPATGWHDARAVSAWLDRYGFSPLRQHGGLVLNPTARDPHAAAQIATDVADRLRARSAVGSRSETEIMSEIYVAGTATPIPTARSRRAEVRALERERTLLEIRDYDSVDQALELLSHLNTAPAPVAAAAGWAAVESLLSGPGDEEKIVTAERLANLVACSWPRAELTTLAWAIVRQPRRPMPRTPSPSRCARARPTNSGRSGYSDRFVPETSCRWRALRTSWRSGACNDSSGRLAPNCSASESALARRCDGSIANATWSCTEGRRRASASPRRFAPLPRSSVQASTESRMLRSWTESARSRSQRGHK